jgi:hypothetical protein
VQSLQRTPFLAEEARQSRHRHRNIRRVPPISRYTAHRKRMGLLYQKHEEEAWIIDDNRQGQCVHGHVLWAVGTLKATGLQPQGNWFFFTPPTLNIVLAFYQLTNSRKLSRRPSSSHPTILLHPSAVISFTPQAIDQYIPGRKARWRQWLIHVVGLA